MNKKLEELKQTLSSGHDKPEEYIASRKRKDAD